MSEPFIGEIRAFPYTYVMDSGQTGWLPCCGQQLLVAQYQALYSIVGQNYLPANTSVNQQYFYLPDLSGRVALGQGLASGGRSVVRHVLATTGGETTVVLSNATTPPHTHVLQKNNPIKGNAQKTSAPIADKSDLDSLVDATTNAPYYDIVTSASSINTNLNPTMISIAGAQSPTAHNNIQPYLNIMYYIAYMGDYPIHQ
jgi:microcystin-dependent protein